MSETEWLSCTDPHPMLDFLKGNASDRKLRLFAVACSRRVWSCIDALGQNAVNVAERFANGLAGPEEMRAARLACQGAGGLAAWYPAATNPAIAARNAARSAEAGLAHTLPARSLGEELLAQADLVRDIFGNSFHHSSATPSWLMPDVVTLAQTIYDERAFDRLPALADAIRKAGCTDQDILSHLMSPGPHVRGCWAVDLALGKE